MGDCRLIFHVHSSLCKSVSGSSLDGPRKSSLQAEDRRNDTKNDTVVLTQTFSADTTIREVMDQTILPQSNKESVEPPGSLRINGDNSSNGSNSIRSLLRGNQDAKLWDCTIHPPRDISDWPLDKFSAIKGSKSKTLYDAGWFPSGTFHVLPHGLKPQIGSVDKYEDLQYNKQAPKVASSSASRSSRLQDLHQKKAKPSQILQAARSKPKSQAEQEKEAKRVAEAKASRKEQLEQEEQKEANRKRRLEGCLRKLEANKNNHGSTGKNKNVSAQVRRMLIKSRATGRDNLEMSDRVYMQFNLVQKDYTTNQFKDEVQEFKFFSKQDTVGRLLETFELPAKHQVEFLVPNPDAVADHEFRKLPNLMRLYEAIDSGLLTDSTSAVTLRIFDPSKEKHTPLEPPAQVDPPSNRQSGTNQQLDAPTESDPPAEDNISANRESQNMSSAADPLEDEDAPMLQPTLSTESSIVTFKSVDPSGSKAEDGNPDLSSLELSPNAPVAKNARLLELIAESIRKGKSRSRKASAAAKKVRQMQIKSKAVGDQKRVKLPNRFYFEVVFVSATRQEETTSYEYSIESVKPHFMNGTDSVNRLVRDYYGKERGKSTMEPGQDWDFLILPLDEEDSVVAATAESLSSMELQRILDPSQSFASLENAKVLKPFDKLILIAML